LGEEEVMNTAQSAWKYTEQDLNRFGRQGAWIAAEEIDCMACDQDAFFLLAFLRRYNGPWATFMCTNNLAARLGWTRYRLTEGRRRLIELGLKERAVSLYGIMWCRPVLHAALIQFGSRSGLLALRKYRHHRRGTHGTKRRPRGTRCHPAPALRTARHVSPSHP